jgi:hypothetical protein
VTYHDPRLADPTLLMLAAWNLTHGSPPLPPWPETEGLSALLAHARRLPQRDPWALEDLEPSDTGLGKLLQEARQWSRERGA